MNKSAITFGSIILILVVFLVVLYNDGQKHRGVHASPAAVKYGIEHQITPDSAMTLISKGAAIP